MLTKDDKTPLGWGLPKISNHEVIKKYARLFIYPAYLKVINIILNRHFSNQNNFDEKIDQWYWGHRGLEYGALRRKLDRLYPIKDKSILIAGCGTGRDIPSWVPYGPKVVAGVDYFNYQRAWNTISNRYEVDTNITFFQGDLNHLDSMANHTFDIIGSDAVFEHVRDLPQVLGEFYRILKPGGVVYATFGPLWYCWGGDHVSGYDANSSGYNHILLDRDKYQQYLMGKGRFQHLEHDGRTWINNQMFSYLKPKEYVEKLHQAGFEKLHLGVVIEPRAIRFLKENQEQRNKLMEKAAEFDLIVTGMNIIFRRTA